MREGKSIDRFQGPTRWLSNFEYVDITMADGITYPTTEHAFQAQKTLDLKERQRIADLDTPGKAKRAGQKVQLREDWEDIKYNVMKSVTRRKFQNPELRKKLLDTGDAELIEGNNWGDRTWGQVDGVGKNYLGRILMKVRERIQNDEPV